ncbi:MAG: MYXO-CTERM sorting domain-containing protein [Myxococcota bacterium]
MRPGILGGMLLLSASLAVAADTYEDDFSADLGRWTGGGVADGVLVVTDGTTTLPLGALASFYGTLRVRLAAGETLTVGVGDQAWTADYRPGGGVTLGADALPLPTGHYAWEPDADPVIEPGADAWDAGNTLHSEVYYDDATATWFLYWTGEMAPPGYGYRQIGLATSRDGVNWTKYAGNPVLTIDYDHTTVDGIHVHMPTVVKDGADWHMFYSCYQDSVGNRICHATSPDGYTWTPEGVALDFGVGGEIDSGSLRMPDVLIGPDGTWHMLYNATDPEQHYGPTAYATSADGWTWTKHAPLSADELRFQGGGLYDGPYGIEQWWNCNDVFCHSTAQWSDLTTWVDEPDVVLAKGWSWWNDGYIQAPTPWLVGTTWHMWFNGYTYTDAHERIGHAQSVPVPGRWFDLALAWDGTTLTVTQSGATQTVALDAVDALVITVVGAAEVDSVALAWEGAPVDTAGDTGGDTATGDTAGDTATGDTAADTDDTPADTDTEGMADGCGCAGTGAAPAWAAVVAALGLSGRRRRGRTRRLIG